MNSQLLTSKQHERFRIAHRRLLVGVGLAIAYFGGVVVLSRVVPLEPYGPWIGIGVFALAGIVIWCMHGYRCPACGEVPRARVWSFWSGEVAYSSMVALFPEKCSSCGVRFRERGLGPGVKSGPPGSGQ